MKRTILTKAVTVTGPDLFGRNSSLLFVPAREPGWYVKTRHAGIVPLDHRYARTKKGRIQFRFGGTTLNIIEHPLSLKTLIGLDEVILIPKDPWPPYIGGAVGYLAQLKNALWESTYDFKSIEPMRSVELESNNRLLSSISIAKPEQPGNLVLTISCQWPQLPRHQQTFTKKDLSNKAFVQNIIASLPQGFPHHRKKICKVFAAFGWPNMKYISWKNDFANPQDAALAWWAHGAQDTCGALGLCHHEYYPSMKLFRWKGGHALDVAAIKQAYS